MYQRDQRTTAEKIKAVCPRHVGCPDYHPGMGDGLGTKCYGDHESCKVYHQREDDNRQ